MRIAINPLAGRAIVARDASPSLRVHRFAARIAGRYETRALQRQMRVGMEFARPWALHIITRRYWRKSTVHVAPHFHLRLQATRAATAPYDRGTSLPMPLVDVRPAEAGRHTKETLIEYVHTRSRRVEPTFGSTSLQPATPVARVVRRLAPVGAIARAEAEPAQDGPRIAKRDDTRAVKSSAPIVAAPPVDLERLTEQVIKGIDRRIVAQRERFGRL